MEKEKNEKINEKKQKKQSRKMVVITLQQNLDLDGYGIKKASLVYYQA